MSAPEPSSTWSAYPSPTATAYPSRAPSPSRELSKEETGSNNCNCDPPQDNADNPPTFSPRVYNFARRVHGWSWQAWPCAMGTGAVYVLLSGLHNAPEWVTIIEMIFFFLVLVMFVTISSVLLLQLFMFPRQSIRLVVDPVKGIFVPLIVLSFATITIGTMQYGVRHANIISPGVLYVLFWVYLAFAIVVCVPMLLIWLNRPHEIKHFTPAWMFLVFPLMLTGVVGFNVLDVLPSQSQRALDVLVVSYFFQGLGTMITFMYLALYVLRVITTGFMEGHQANGAFVACGPPGFTALALLNLGEEAREVLPAHNLISPLAGEVWYAGSVMVAIMLLGLATFFFVIAVLPYWFKVHKHLNEILGCWALSFPLVGMVNGFKAIGDIFQSQFLWTLHAIFTTVICIVWLCLASLTALAIWKGEIFRSKDEDVWRDASARSLVSGPRLHAKAREAAKAQDAPPHIV